MSNSSNNSLLYTLRGKIWISTGVLAFFISTFGLISYLVVTLLTDNPLFGVFIPYLLLSFSVIAFGWWLSNEMVGPIDKVILLAKSLERNSSATLPRTTGSTETDQLLASLNRNSHQLQNVMTLMDQVAGGNVDVTLTPLESSDRLTNSFKKLLEKVSESLHAKEDLTTLETELDKIISELATIRKGNLNVNFQTDSVLTKELAETYNYLTDNLTSLVSHIKLDSNAAQDSANLLEEKLELFVKQDEQRIRKMDQASLTLKQVPNFIQKITNNLSQSAKTAKQTIDKTRRGAAISQENSEAVAALRSRMRESINSIQSLSERTQEIAKVAKTVEDLANRTNMIALNTSIHATEFGDEGKSLVLVSEELERLATRADGTNKQISKLNNTILSEIGRVEDSFKITSGGVSDLSKHSIETGNILGELERYVGQFLNLQNNLIAISSDHSETTDEAFGSIEKFTNESKNNISNLTNSTDEVKKIARLMKDLESQAFDYKTAKQEIIQDEPEHSSVNEIPNFEEDNSSSKIDTYFQLEEDGNQGVADQKPSESDNSQFGEFPNDDVSSVNSQLAKLEDFDSKQTESHNNDLNDKNLISSDFDSEDFLDNQILDHNLNSEELFTDNLDVDLDSYSAKSEKLDDKDKDKLLSQ